MKKLRELIEDTVAKEKEVYVWVAIPAGVLFGKIFIGESYEPTEEAFYLDDAEFFKPMQFYPALPQVSYAHVSAWGILAKKAVGIINAAKENP